MMLSRRSFIALMLSGAVAACTHRSARHALPAGSTVVALGDSLTFGYGAAPAEAYPAQLAVLSGWRVINGGVSGDTSEQALARLPALLRHRPKLLLLGIGGNDFLRGIPEQATRTHIGRMIGLAEKAGVPVVLVAVPRPTVAGGLFGSLNDHPLYRDLAEAHGVDVFEDAWSDILGRRDLKSDAIHANARGYRLFAERLAGFLKKRGWL